MNEAAEQFHRLVRARRSVRGFTSEPVPNETIKEVFELAQWSPSGTNVQPWNICVASGDTCERLRQGFLERFDADAPVRTDHDGDGRAVGAWRERKRSCAKALYDAMGIEWEDREGRGRAARRNFEFFDAPHTAFLCLHESFGMQSAADVGMFAQTLMLAMTAHGIASCAQGTLRNYPDFVREEFQLEPEIKILFGISFGYEDAIVLANNARTDRANLEETVQFFL